MQVVYERCCGLDVHKKTVVACRLLSQWSSSSSPISRRRKSPNRFLDGPFLLAQQPTCYDGFLVDIQATTAFIHDLHSLSPFKNSFCL